jgi:ribosomal protein S18 acetylase RimI-like enzyme
MSKDHSIVAATIADAAALSVLVNSAYRGESSKKGWTTEADLLDGQRTDEASLQRMIETPGNTILKYMDHSSQLLGCVYLQQKGSKLYLGMLTVSPELQAKGIGKQLLAASEAFASRVNAKGITMTVISVRDELIAWYQRHGYTATGETEPFPIDPKFGLPKQALHFIVMEKNLQ